MGKTFCGERRYSIEITRPPERDASLDVVGRYDLGLP